jgi:DNA-binding CsgD family transcriptional regulator
LAAGFAQWYAVKRQLEKCADLLHRVITALSSAGAEPMLPILVAAHGDLADVPRARGLLEQWAKPDGNRIGHAYLGLFDAHAALRRGGRDSAAAEKAAQAFHGLGLPYYEAQALELADRRADALALYRRIEAHGDRQRLEAILALPNRHGRRTTELTPREREIAALVTAGKSNRAIAETLVISERTVESHVAAILAKLQIGSRAELHLVFADRVPHSGGRSLGG